MPIKPLKNDLVAFLTKHSLKKKYSKQLSFLESDWTHPSLNIERLNPKVFKLYSFRIDRRYRAIFTVHESGEIEILDINNHYQ
ncbi:MAG: hypothetical protein A3A61_02795 [Candidatus Woykebacteria bacterium RIFCSPLOWO2_01_FULL_43_14]|uniref:Toxin YoeB n=1 Tax=Candidatus Woykebacteria bacterium RIFCSPLOWO2_01_FULL_43_14 TaxID=1802605 RepID=A0A1G1WWJ2_9BACT|nr:MAG: hypothetical protein A3A61_02795 [Candidatus Woykebacteria bacterium RIFCSPLOWO2_01_FULL_43_14]